VDAVQIADAAAALDGLVVRTPLVAAPALGPQIWIKCELMQRSGSFKLRGVLNKMRSLTPQQRAAGVTTVSAGNHARALALACSTEGIAARVFMPASASEYKVAATRALGAEVDLESADSAEAFARMHAHVEATGATVVHPFDDPAIIAGAGTVGREIVADLPEVSTVVVPVGGGGLISGIALAVKAARPRARIVAVEPADAATLSAALGAGKLVEVPHGGTAADALAPPSVGERPLAVCRELVDEVVVLSEDELRAGLRAAYADAKLACEVGGAAAIAALVTGRIDPGGPTVLVASGGNIAAAELCRLLA
jgi:threonine dehydratase